MERMPDYETISPRELKERLDAGDRPELLDVREPWEFELARIEGSKLIPMGELSERVSELDPAAETVVICHHGNRSAYVAYALQQAGFTKVRNLEGEHDRLRVFQTQFFLHDPSDLRDLPARLLGDLAAHGLRVELLADLD